MNLWGEHLPWAEAFQCVIFSGLLLVGVVYFVGGPDTARSALCAAFERFQRAAYSR